MTKFQAEKGPAKREDVPLKKEEPSPRKHGKDGKFLPVKKKKKP